MESLLPIIINLISGAVGGNVAGGLMKKLVYLTQGLSVILAFIGVKLLFEAMHSQGWDHIWIFTVPHISLQFSLGTIISTLALTSAFSLYKTRGQ